MAPTAAVHQRPICWLSTSWTLGFMTVYLGITLFIAMNVPENYMDEPFHVPMAQRYCQGDVFTWDPKITTFPGLYFLGAAYAWASKLLLSWTGVGLEVTCSGPFLRSLNALLAVVTLQLAYAISMELQQIHNRSSTSTAPQLQLQHSRAVGLALVIGLLPTQLFFAFLFYTDVPSLVFLLLTELLLLRHSTYAAAAAGAAAVGMRQTNAVWVTFLTGAAILRDASALAASPSKTSAANSSLESSIACSKAANENGSTQDSGKASQADDRRPLTELTSVLQDLQGILRNAWSQKRSLLTSYSLLLILPAAFVVFVIWNGGITLGDREAHAPTVHLMQPLYFALFCLGSAAPLLLQPAVVSRVRAALNAAPVASSAAAALATAAAALCIQRYSLVHPYLLADNRHYTFYLWRKVLGRHELIRLAAAPAYVAGWVLLLAGLSATEHWLWVVAWVTSCWVTLAPAWLIEFRYFTTPAVLALLHMPLPPKRHSLLTAACYCCVNALTLWVFAKRPFTWGDGSVARFMW